MAIEGGCLCGAVRYTCEEESGGGHCHCLDCRKSSGTGHCSHMVVPEAGFSVTGEVRFFDKPADSGNMISRGFCPVCGSPLYSKNAGMPGLVFLRASSLDDPEHFRPIMVVYTDRAASWDKVDRHCPVSPPCRQGSSARREVRCGRRLEVSNARSPYAAMIRNR